MKTLTSTVLLLAFLMQSYGQVERDKVLHFTGGALFGLAGAGVAKQISDGNRTWTFVGAVVGSALAGIAKESIDAGQDGNQWDNDDLAATILGGITVGVAIEVFSKKRNKQGPRGSLTTEYLEPINFRTNYSDMDVLVQQDKLPTLTSFGFSSKFLMNSSR
ncbi:hypothetical protein FVB32_16905 [Flagellimonas hymeniacidonis]|uniref:Uncharacterized protein n=1 Tax=Flagellimonas hymeniacidonis TaxID=2603628 RepID=A0A5C8V605_9FLAO|nr:hypothetical protein [Flagellimonas hymeniacidonis]TXN36228.1 hypothetical protein FVB32_16905 [Flagellimonas hymeniacidonis]